MTGTELPVATSALLHAHALGTLDAGAAERADLLIARSETCRHVFEDALVHVTQLALRTVGAAPPPGLRTRILEAAQGSRRP